MQHCWRIGPLYQLLPDMRSVSIRITDDVQNESAVVEAASDWVTKYMLVVSHFPSFIPCCK